MSRYFWAMPADCEWPFDKKPKGKTASIKFDLAPHFVAVLDALIEKQFQESGMRWTRDEAAMRLLAESLRQWRDRTPICEKKN